MNADNEQPKKLPTRIVEEPRRISCGNAVYIECLCDDGKIYTQSELALLFNCQPSTIGYRIKKYGYGNPLVLSPGKGQHIKKTSTVVGVAKEPYACCPVTGNMPTKCMEESFFRSCEKKRQQLNPNKSPLHPYCQVCKGERLPKGLEFISVTYLEEEQMGRKTGRCDGCQELKTIQSCSGKQLCTSCGIVWNFCRNKPEIVLAMLKDAGTVPLPVVPGEDEQQNAQEESASCVDNFGEMVFEAKTQYIEILKDKIKELEATVSDLHSEKQNEPVAAAEPVFYSTDVERKLLAIAWKISDVVNGGDVAQVDGMIFRYDQFRYEDAVFLRFLAVQQ